MSDTNHPQARQAAGRRMFLILSALILLPFVLAALLYFSGWRPALAKPYGTALPPAAALRLNTLDIIAGPQHNLLETRWLFVIAGPCGEGCADRLDQARRIHTALYKSIPRVRRVVLADAVPPGIQPDLTVARVSGDWARLVTPELTLTLVDPTGNAIFRYPLGAANFAPNAMLKDVERLLRHSWAG